MSMRYLFAGPKMADYCTVAYEGAEAEKMVRAGDALSSEQYASLTEYSRKDVDRWQREGVVVVEQDGPQAAEPASEAAPRKRGAGKE